MPIINDIELVINSFLDRCSAKTISFYSKRDNCGPAALDFISWCKTYYPELCLTRVHGYFRADEIVCAKADFTLDMQKELIGLGLIFSDASHRKYFIEHSKYFDNWRNIPHYWCIDQNSNIYDVVGKLQFVQSGLSENLDISRYLLNEPAVTNEF